MGPPGFFVPEILTALGYNPDQVKDYFKNLTSLTHLDMTGRAPADIMYPEGMFAIPTLKVLTLSHVTISQIPPEISTLSNLEELHIFEVSGLEEIGSGNFSGLSNLKIL